MSFLRRIRLRYWLLAGLCVTVIVLWLRSRDHYEEPPMPFSGSSADLKQTVVVPTLATPIPKGKSAIWCSSLQIAWNHLKDDVVGAPVRIRNAETLAERLNQAGQSETDLAPGTCYAAAGMVKD